MTLKLLEVTNSLDPEYGGPPAAAVATALALRRRRIDTTVIFPFKPRRASVSDPFLAKLRGAGVICHGFPEPTLFGSVGSRWGISPRLAFWMLRNTRRFDVVHAHSPWAFTTVIALVAAKLFRRAAVLTAHESLTDFDRAKSGVFSRLMKRVLRGMFLRTFDLVVVASDLEQRDSGARQNVVVVPHAVDIPSRARNGRRHSGAVRVGTLARLDPKKNIEVLIDMLGKVPEATLIVGGDGPSDYRDALVTRAAERGVDRRIDWRGFVDEQAKHAFLEEIDVFALPSAYECFGIAVVEAMGAGVPVVVSPTVGVAPAVARGRCGYVVPPTADAVAAAIRAAARDAPVLGARGAAAAAEFALDVHGERLARSFVDLLDRPRRPRLTAAGAKR